MKQLTRSLFLLTFFIAPVWAEETPNDATQLIQSADALYPERWDVKKNQEALAIYKKVLAQDPQHVEALWKASRSQWWIGSLLTARPDRISAFQEGMKLGEKAIQLDPNNAEAHFWLGGNYASFGNVKGAFTSLGLIKSIRKEMKEVIRINGDIVGGGAYRILGILDYKVPGFMGGDKKRALEQLLRSQSIHPNNPLTLFYLSEYYLSVNQKEKAREYLQLFKTTTPPDGWVPEQQMMLKQLPELEKSLK